MIVLFAILLYIIGFGVFAPKIGTTPALVIPMMLCITLATGILMAM